MAGHIEPILRKEKVNRKSDPAIKPQSPPPSPTTSSSGVPSTAKGSPAFSNSTTHWRLSVQTYEPFGEEFAFKSPTSKTVICGNQTKEKRKRNLSTPNTGINMWLGQGDAERLRDASRVSVKYLDYAISHKPEKE